MTRSKQENREFTRASGVMAFFTMISRILGLVRNQLLGHFFGAGFAADAFIAAFTIPNALRRLFGEGALTPAFVSLFMRHLRSGPQSWRGFLSSTFYWQTLVVGGLACLGMIYAEPLVRLYVPDFADEAGKLELTVQLTQILFPFILIISWAALAMGVLNSFRKFALPAFGPAILNLSVILLVPSFILYFSPDFEPKIYIFAFAILAGVCVQVGAQIPSLVKLKAFPSFKFRWKDSRVWALAQLLIPSIFGMGVYQLNIIVNRRFASDIPGAVSHLFYSDLLIELPVSLIATSMSVAAVPSFTRLIVEKDKRSLSQTFEYAMSLNLSLALPAALGLLSLALPLISMIFQTGRFEYSDSLVASQCLQAYALGLPFFCALRTLIPLFYGFKDTRSPVYAGILALVVNFLAAWQLSQVFGAPGIALATSISALVNFLALSLLLRHHFRDFSWVKIFVAFLKASLAAGLMVVCIRFGAQLISPNLWTEPGIKLSKILAGLGLVGFGAIVYFSSALLLKVPAISDLIRKLLKRT